MSRKVISVLAIVVVGLSAMISGRAQAPDASVAPRPIEAGDSLWTEELTEYYTEDQWSWKFLKSQGIVQIDETPPAAEAKDRLAHTRNGMHDDVYYEAQIAVQDPALIRAEQRIKAGRFSLHGVDLAPVSKTVEIGRKLAEYRAGITARAFEASMERLRGKGPGE